MPPPTEIAIAREFIIVPAFAFVFLRGEEQDQKNHSLKFVDKSKILILVNDTTL